MNLTTIAGLIIAIVGLIFGMYFKGVAFSALLQPAAYFIILMGTAGAVTIATPGERLKTLPKLFGILFGGSKSMTKTQAINSILEFSETTRREGLLALESKLASINDPFLSTGVRLLMDGAQSEYIVSVMEEEISAMEDRHAANAQIFTQAGTYAPTLGVLGAVMGLIAALGEMSDTEKLGRAIAAAFVATLLGIFTGYVIWLPFANKLKQKSKLEVEVRRIVIEGILGLQEGQSTTMLKDRMMAQISESERASLGKKQQ